MERKMVTLKKAMRMLDNGEPWTIGTENGNGWLFYFDGEKIHEGTRYGLTLQDLLERACIEIYEREERKHWFKEDKRNFMELEAGMAFIVAGNENGTI